MTYTWGGGVGSGSIPTLGSSPTGEALALEVVVDCGDPAAVAPTAAVESCRRAQPAIRTARQIMTTGTRRLTFGRRDRAPAILDFISIYYTTSPDEGTKSLAPA
jgi:hypothetical protein